jgi:undecaprenyl-diphosphatase
MLVGGAALLVGSGRLAREELTDEEVSTFRALNEQSDAMRDAAWALMLGGTFGAVPAAAGLALLTGHRRLALELAVGGSAAYVLAKAVKPVVGRARPHGLLRDVRFRDEIGGNEGWISGHAAVSTSLALIAAPELPRAGRVAAYGAAAGIGVSRLYAGAHMPLDVVGGAGLAMMIAALMPDPRRR